MPSPLPLHSSLCLLGLTLASGGAAQAARAGDAADGASTAKASDCDNRRAAVCTRFRDAVNARASR